MIFANKFLYFVLTAFLFFAFMISTLIKNGNGTAIVVVIVGFIFFIFAEPLEYSQYNVFLNPFAEPAT